MTPIVVGAAAVETLRRLGAPERRIVSENIKTIRHDPGRAGIPTGDEFLPPETWRHACPDSTFMVFYRWASDREETLAMADIIASLRRESDPPSPTHGEAGIVIVNVASYVAL